MIHLIDFPIWRRDTTDDSCDLLKKPNNKEVSKNV